MKPETLQKVRKRITWSALGIVAISLLVFSFMYGPYRVVDGMDTMIPKLSPGSMCVIRKNPSTVKAGSVIILELGGGEGLLSRVERIEGDSVFIKHDNRASRFLGHEQRSYSMSQVRGLVLGALGPDARPPGESDGK